MRPTMTRRSTLLSIAGLALGAALLTGCASSGNEVKVTHGYFTDRDITPVADSKQGSADAIDRMVAFQRDNNERAMNSDLHRFFLLDRPSSLTPGKSIRW